MNNFSIIKFIPPICKFYTYNIKLLVYPVRWFLWTSYSSSFVPGGPTCPFIVTKTCVTDCVVESSVALSMLYARSSVNVLSTGVFNILVKMGLCTKPVRTYDVGAPSAITISLPGMDPVDAERRR